MLFVAFSGNAEETTSSFNIIQPLDKTRYTGENSTFVFDAALENVDTIVITQDNDKTTTLKVKASRKTYCKTIKLHIGENKILVSSYKDGKLLNTYKRNFYFFSELFEGANEDDAENFKIRNFHTDEKEDRCKSCHDMTSNVPTNNEALDDVTKTTCYKCHNSMLDTKNTHAPAANWLCLNCHDGKVGKYNIESGSPSKYSAPDPIAKNCAVCHDTVEGWMASKYEHGPVVNGRCIICHNPHGSDNEFFLRKHIWDLCTTCHTEKAIPGNHIIASFVFQRNGGAHPTKGAMDPARPGRKFVCTSCHNPHGSEGIFLLRMKGSQPFNVCKRCHKK